MSAAMPADAEGKELAQLHAVYAAMNEGLVVFDARGGMVVANEAAARICGYASVEEMKRSLSGFAEAFELFDADGRPVPFEDWPVMRMLRGERVVNVELAMRRKDTERESFIRFSGQPVLDDSGAPVLAVLISSDVTERVVRERALRASEERFRALADSMPQLVWTAEGDGVVDYYNARAREYAGLTRAEDGSWTWQPVVHPDDLDATLRAWTGSAQTGSAYECEHRVRMADGSYRWHVSRARRSSARGGKWFGTATDIHDQKLAEEGLRQAMATRGQVVSAVAHDLRNPLYVVRMSLPLLREAIGEAPDPEVRQRGDSYIHRLDRQVTKMERLLGEFLDAATLQAGQPLELERRRCDLLPRVREILAEPHERAAERLELVTNVSRAMGHWDLDRLERVIENLVSNALKYSPRESLVTVRVDAAPSRVTVSVSDRGIGIAEQDRARIFDWFARGGNAQSMSRGIGIGLAGARSIVEQHGGTLSVQSELGVGSTFAIELPLDGAP